MSIPVLLSLLLAATPVPVTPVAAGEADEFTLLADDWARPRSGARVAALPALRAAVLAWIERPGTRILVIHPGGETGSLWGAEVRDWMIALGIAPDSVALRPGSPRDDALILRLDTP